VSLLDRKLVRDVGRRRWQFVAIVVTVLLGVTLFGASYDAYQNLLASYRALFDRTHFAALTIQGGNPDQVAAAIADDPGVAAVQARSVADLPLRIGDATLVAQVVGLPEDRRARVNDVLVLSGDYLAAADRSGVLVERHMADHFGLSAGDSIELRLPSGWTRLTVRGIAASAEYIWPARSRQEVLTLPDQFGVVFAPQALLDALPAAATIPQVAVGYRGAADDATLTARLVDAALGAGATSAFTQAEQPSNAALHEDINGFGELSLLFPLLFLGAAALAAYVLLSRLVAQQRAQIGLLLAVGYARRRLFLHYIGFGVAIGLLGATAGAVLGLALAGIITNVYTGVIAIPITVVQIRPLTVVLGLAFGIVAGAVGALVPALRAARLSPAAAMSGSMTAAAHGGETLIERVVPPLRALPARWKLVLRGIGRAPLRSVSTAVGVVLAVTLVFVSWAMLDTVQLLLERQFDQAQQADVSLSLTSPVTPAVLRDIVAVSGVAAAEPVSELPVTIEHAGHRYATSLVAFPPRTSMHDFLTASGSTELPATGILLGSALRTELGLAAGDEVAVAFTGLDRDAQVRVAGFVDEPLGTYAYGSLPQLSQLIGSEAAAEATSGVNLRFTSGTGTAAALPKLRDLDGVAVVTDLHALQGVAQSLMGLFYAFVGAMLVLGAVMAFAMLFNVMSANIGERLTELASLRASGMSGRQLALLITAENVVLTVSGIIPGLLVGYVAAAAFMASFSSDLFSFDLRVRPTTFLFSALGVVLAALVSQLPIVSAVRRIDIARVVRERAL
jgi:putative ABC transport system permease protein